MEFLDISLILVEVLRLLPSYDPDENPTCQQYSYYLCVCEASVGTKSFFPKAPAARGGF